MRNHLLKFIAILSVCFLIVIFSAGFYFSNMESRYITLTPQFTVVTVSQSDAIFALSNFNNNEGTFLWNVTFIHGNLSSIQYINTSHSDTLEIKANETGEFYVTVDLSLPQMRIKSDTIQVDVLTGFSNLRINSNAKGTNLTSPVKFSISGSYDNLSRIVIGFEWFINGTPLQNDAGPTATVLFQRAGIYQVYAEAVFYNGSSIMSNRVQMQVVPSGFWNGSDMAAVGGYYSGPLLIHTPSNYSAYVLWNGPGVYLPQGEYIVNFTMAISNTTGSSYPVISLEVQGSVNSTASVVFAKNIVRGDFPGPDKFTTFTMVFNQTFQRNIGFNFMGNSASTNLTIFLRYISVNPAGIQRIKNETHLAIEADSEITNLTTPVTFSTFGIPAGYREAVTGFEWFINGTPLQNDAGSTATILFQRAGIYSVYTKDVIDFPHKFCCVEQLFK